MISGNGVDLELFYVTRQSYYDANKIDVRLASKKELQSELVRHNRIIKIERAVITKGEEVSLEYFKPKKYKGKPWTYKERYFENS